MNLQMVKTLCSEQVKRAIEESIERDATAVALDKKIEHASIVATQVKYLQRAERKLPSYYAARCIIPARAYEQSSSEATAATKEISGGTLLELTCGLGVDTFALSKRFDRVVTLERDEVLAAIARINFERLGVSNIEVVTSSAEDYLDSCSEHFDAIYADPDRRTVSGDRVIRLEECTPNIIELLPRLRELADVLVVKNSPLFDIDEAFRLFSPAKVEVISLGGECKEVVVTTPYSEDIVECRAIGADGVVRLTIPAIEVDNTPSMEEFASERYKYLITPDVALLKSRVACSAMRPIASIWSNTGYAFTESEPADGVMGRVEMVDSIEEYNPRRLKKWLKEEGLTSIEILKRDFARPIERVAKELGVKIGGKRRIAFTTIGGKHYSIILK